MEAQVKQIPVDGYKTMLDNNKIGLQAPHPTKKGVWMRLGLGMSQGNTRFVLNTNDPDTKGRRDAAIPFGRIVAAFDLMMGLVIADYLEKVIESNEPCEYKFTARGYQQGNRDNKEVVDLAAITVGRGKEGFIGIVFEPIADKFPVSRFRFGPDKRFLRMEENDNVIEGPRQSSDFARAWVSLLRATPTIAALNYVPYSPDRNGGGGKGGGNWSKGGGHGGGSSAPAASTEQDDDIFF